MSENFKKNDKINLIGLFIRFLKEEGLIRIFERNYKKWCVQIPGERKDLNETLMESHPSCFLSFCFSWSLSKEDYWFWLYKNKDWLTYLQENADYKNGIWIKKEKI